MKVKNITKEKLLPVTGVRADAAKAEMVARGSTNVEIFTCLDFGIVSSVDPSGANGELEFHVSVSKHGAAVSPAVTKVIARLLVPGVSGWTLSPGDIATHVFAPIPEGNSLCQQ